MSAADLVIATMYANAARARDIVGAYMAPITVNATPADKDMALGIAAAAVVSMLTERNPARLRKWAHDAWSCTERRYAAIRLVGVARSQTTYLDELRSNLMVVDPCFTELGSDDVQSVIRHRSAVGALASLVVKSRALDFTNYNLKNVSAGLNAAVQLIKANGGQSLRHVELRLVCISAMRCAGMATASTLGSAVESSHDAATVGGTAIFLAATGGHERLVALYDSSLTPEERADTALSLTNAYGAEFPFLPPEEREKQAQSYKELLDLVLAGGENSTIALPQVQAVMEELGTSEGSRPNYPRLLARVLGASETRQALKKIRDGASRARQVAKRW